LGTCLKNKMESRRDIPVSGELQLAAENGDYTGVRRSCVRWRVTVTERMGVAAEQHNRCTAGIMRVN
jgi:hypothetical protein